MTAPAVTDGEVLGSHAPSAPSDRSARAWPALRPVAIAAGLAVVVVGRWTAYRSGAVDPIVLGALFGGGLLALGWGAGWRLQHWAGPKQAGRALALAGALGVAGGVGLALTALAGGTSAWPGDVAAGFPLAPWAAATVLVACAEEIVLRGALFDAVSRPHGVAAAVVLTSIVFALMHIPVYGWHAVPLDLGVGLVLGGLRLVSGGVLAPAIAHAVADLAAVLL